MTDDGWGFFSVGIAAGAPRLLGEFGIDAVIEPLYGSCPGDWSRWTGVVGAPRCRSTSP
jgi:hypothetical protein